MVTFYMDKGTHSANNFINLYELLWGKEKNVVRWAYNYIKNFNLSNGRFYENDICVIRKGIINTTTKKEWKRNNKNR